MLLRILAQKGPKAAPKKAAPLTSALAAALPTSPQFNHPASVQPKSAPSPNSPLLQLPQIQQASFASAPQQKIPLRDALITAAIGTLFPGLGALAGGVANGAVENRKLFDTEQAQGQQISSSRLKNSAALYQILGQLGQNDPQALSTPAMQAFIKGQVGQGGIPLPMAPTGQIDTQAFMPSLVSLRNDPRLFPQFLQYPKGSPERQEILAGRGGTPQEKQALLDLPRVYTSAAQASASARNDYLLAKIAGGLRKTPAVLASINANLNIQGLPPVTMSDLPGMSKKVEAQVENTIERTQKTAAEIPWIPLKNEAIVAMDKGRGLYYTAKGTAVPVQLQQGWARIAQSAQALELRGQALDVSRQHLAIAAQNANTQTVRTAQDLYKESLIQYRADQVLEKDLNGAIASLAAANAGNASFNAATDPDMKGLREQLTATQTRLQSEQQFIQGYPTLIRGIHAKAQQGAHSGLFPTIPKVGPYGPAVKDTKTGTVYQWDPQSGAYLDAAGNPIPPADEPPKP